MKTARVGACLAIVLMGILTSPLLAQYPPPSQRPAQTGDSDTNDFFGPRNFQFRSDIGDGVGYSKGFQTFGAFQSFVVAPEELIFFANPRGIITYLGNVSANVGAGVRYYNEDSDRILGASFWYDHDNNGNTRYDQLGVSLEWLGKYFDVRANGYVPTNPGRDKLGTFLNGTTSFFQNFIGIGQSTIFNTPLEGGDFEIGGLLPGIGDVGIRPYVGGYYYQGQDVTPAYGVRARIEALITQDFWGQVLYSNDPLFGSNVMGAVTWYYGSGQAPRWFQRIPVQDRLYQQVERQYRVAVYEEVFNDTVLALRAGGTGGSGGPVGTPIFVVHVNNAAAAGGDGTVEHPLNYLPTTTPGNVDIVFVRRGNGTFTNYDHGITLNNYQRLLGDGVHHNFTSLAGTFALPGYTPGAMPTLTNPSGDVVTLASYNEVSGFNITSAGRHGIHGEGITDFNINNVNITSSANAGIDLVDASGTGQIFDSTMTNNTANGININDFGTALALSVNNVTATGNLNGIAIQGQAGATFAVAMNSVNVSDNNHGGIALDLASGTTFAGTFSGITANSNNNPEGDLNFGNGFSAVVDASVASIDIENSTLNSNNLNGVSVVATNNSTVNLSLINNNSTISNNLLNGVFVDGTDSDIAVLLRNNVISNNGGMGVDLNLQGANNSYDMSLIASDNIMTGNHGAGLAYTLIDAATGTIDIRNNTITGTLHGTSAQGLTYAYGRALNIHLNGSTTSSAATASLTSGVIDGNTISNNLGDGLTVIADQNTTLSNLSITNNQIESNGEVSTTVLRGDGINIARSGAAVVNNVLIGGNKVRTNGDDGIEISQFGSPNDVADYTLVNNTITGNGVNSALDGHGVFYNLGSDGQMSANMFNNLVSRNKGDGVRLGEQVSSPLDSRFLTGTWQQNEFTNNSGSGIELNGRVQSLLVGSTSSQTDGNLITGNGLWGLQLNGSGSMTVGFNEISRNLAGGIGIHPGVGDGTPQNPSTSGYDNADNTNVLITRNLIRDNGPVVNDPNNIMGDGIEILSQGAGNAQLGNGAIGVTTVNITFNTIQGNAGRGVDILNRVGQRFAGTAPPGQTSTVNLISSEAHVSLDNNLIANNRYEAVYVINTTAASQTQTANSATLLETSPDTANKTWLGTAPRLFFTMTNNTVTGNGNDSLWSTTGLVLRVGTSDGGYFYTDDGGFFSEGRGGVGATVQNNTFAGNQGDDIYFDSFTSTADPTTTAGTWSATEFKDVRYFGDPLARLDLIFTGNAFDSADVNNAGSPHPGSTAHGAANPYTGAYYNNAEGTFKSRTADATDPGPFGGTDPATRVRNAARLAARFDLNPQTPNAPPPDGGFDSGDFLYAGLGQSTFRLLGVPAPGNIGAYQQAGTSSSQYINGGFLIDNFYTNQFSSNGVFLNVVGLSGESPWGWNINGGLPRPQ